jgi:peroxiredoxin
MEFMKLVRGNRQVWRGPMSNYAFKPIAEQALRSSQTVVPQRLNAALYFIGGFHLYLSALFLTFLVVGGPSFAETPSDYAVPEGFEISVGQRFPDFKLQSYESGTKSLDEFAGSFVVLNFYTIHCGPCHRDVPALNEFQSKNPKVKLVSVTPDDRDLVKEFVSKRALNGSILINAQDYFDSWGVQFFPSFAVIGPNGTLLGATYGNRLGGEDGTVTADGLEKWVKSLVDEI